MIKIMYVREKTRKEIEARLEGMGDYMKMGYLASCLKNHLDLDTRKFVLIKLSGLYEFRNMFFDAAKTIRLAADINTTYQGKITDFLKACDLFIRAGNYEEADACMKRAIALGNEKQRQEIKKTVKEFYKVWARFFAENRKRKQAMKAYEKLLSFELDDVERNEIKENLLEIYDKLGKIREYYTLKGSY